MIVYADVLIFLNTIITYFLIISVCAIFKKRPKIFRIILGAVFGGFCALIIFLPHLNFFMEIVLRIFICCVITLITFSYKNYLYFIKHTVALFLVTTVFGGMMLAILSIFNPYPLVYSNGITYFDISPIILIMLTVFIYLIIRLISYFKSNTVKEELIYNCEITYKNTRITFLAINDTGNSLIDPYFNSPVVIVESCVASDILLCKPKQYLIPVKSVTKDNLLYAFRPDGFFININNSKKEIKDITVAFCEQKINKQYNGIISPKILQLLKED